MSTGKNGEKRYKLLLVEDDKDLAETLREIFISFNFTVYLASDGLKALELMKEDRFDVILSDIRMPFMDGIQLLKKTKVQPLNKNTKFFIMSGTLDAPQLKLISALGVVSVLIKPIDPENVVQKILKAVTEEEAQTQTRSKGYDADIISSVVKALQEVVAFYLGAGGSLGKPFIKSQDSSQGYFTALMAINQKNVSGSTAFSCDLNFLQKLHQQIFGEALTEPTEDLIRDMAGEMCNQISGKIKSNLAQHSYPVLIGLPEIIVGVGHKVKHSGSNPVLVVPMTLDGCVFQVEFTMSAPLEKGEIDTSGDIASGSLLFDE